jgi:hypothetical protein
MSQLTHAGSFMRRQFRRGVDSALVLGDIWVMGARVLLFDNVLGRVVD